MSEPTKKRSLLFRIFRGLVVLALLAVAAFVGVGLFVLDGKYELARDIVIKAPPEAVHKQVGDLREWPNWLPFTKHDKTVKTTIEQPTGVGANEHWTSDNGNGKLKFTASDEQKGIEFDMLFDEKYPAKGTISYAKAGDDTRVTWHMSGQNNDFIGRWMALIMAPMMGPMFQEGLTDLKTKVEAK
ncbi:MAG: SRPBCC family protein [Gemmataceae bacterium]